MADDNDPMTEEDGEVAEMSQPDKAAANGGRQPGRRRIRRGTKVFRRLSGGLALLLALVTVGFLYAALSPTPQTAQAATTDPQQIAAGKSLFQNSCISCHGANLQGVQDKAPSLLGVGSASVYFQVSTGRMPATENGAEMPRKKAVFDETEIDQLGAYIEATGGGPQLPADSKLEDTSQIAKGGELYRLNCASCHNFTGQGGALSQGKAAPSLDESTNRQIYSAMLSGPESMPKFADTQLTPDEKQAIVAFVQNNKQTIDPGGLPLGGFGPAPEGLVAFFVGMVAIVGVTLWMGARA